MRNIDKIEELSKIISGEMSTLVRIINVLIPMNDTEKKQLLLGESMFTQLIREIDNANTLGDYSKIFDVEKMCLDYEHLINQLSTANLTKQSNEWRKKIIADIQEEIEDETKSK